MYKAILTINSEDFNNVEDLLMYWDRHIEKVKEDERLLNLFIDDFNNLELNYIDERTQLYNGSYNAI